MGTNRLLYFARYYYFIWVDDMNGKFLAVFLAAMLPSLSFGQGAQKYQCSHGELERRVEILYETGVTVPCEVHYYKDTEAPGETQVLWRALNESGYCESKAQEFVAQLQEWGWNCGQGDAVEQNAAPEDDSGADAEPVGADDTEALKPVEETESTQDQ